MIKVIHIVGARPQFMKLAPLYDYMGKNNFNQKIIHTGQHFDYNMSEVFFKQLCLPNPDYNLSINNLSHGAMTGRMMEEIEKILLKEDVDFVIIYGDTNSTIAGAITSKKLGLKLVHIESGCRNNDLLMPEELNRIVSDRISDILFCNTEHTKQNLINEGFNNYDCILENSGDLMFDCLKLFNNKMQDNKSNHILVTIHRAENTELENLSNIISALNEIANTYEIVFPIHPRTKNKIKHYGIEVNFKTSPPMDYITFLNNLNSSRYLLSDSGGAIREAYWLNIPSLQLLENPVWPELIKAKVCLNSKAESEQIKKNFKKLEKLNLNFPESIFGDGNASKIIVETLEKYYENNMDIKLN